jgi:glutaminase
MQIQEGKPRKPIKNGTIPGEPEGGRPVLDTRERHLYRSMLTLGEDRVRASEVRRVLEEAGLRADDPRLRSIIGALRDLPADAQLDEHDFFDIVRPGILALEAAVTRSLVIPEFPDFKQRVLAIFDETVDNHEGAVADYIPQLSRVDPELYGMSICTIDGQRIRAGDADERFCVQSVSKAISYCLALEELGEDTVHAHMGCEPSGVSFNELSLNPEGRPHNPMINAGGIMCAALIQRHLPIADRFDHVATMWARLAGGSPPGFSNAVYLSERATADRNFALGYSMREHRAFPEGSDLIESLEFYFQICSLEMTAETLSVVAATLAGGGLCPLTGEQVLQPRTVQSCLSLMLSCGMYDYSGEWAFRIGLPAKSGVSGVVMTVVPNVLGICTWSPRLDTQGNSVRGIEFCKRLVQRFNFHVYDGLGESHSDKLDPRLREDADERQFMLDTCWAASEGDLEGLQRLVLRGADPNAEDYDGRTPLHLAASEGRADAVRLLLKLGASPDARDRWGNTPLDDAKREGAGDVERILSSDAASRKSAG